MGRGNKEINWLKAIFNILFVFAVYNTTIAQTADFKPGKINITDLEIKPCPIDSNSGAYIISDIGRAYFEYTQHSGFLIYFDRKVRIKILKNKDFDEANFHIRLHSGTEGFEKFRINDGFTFNLENGKIIKSKLTSESQFEELVTSNIKRIKISMPNIREGSVIDLDYTIISPYSNIHNWYFQHDIPVLSSQFTVEIPEFYSYKKFLNGFIKVSTKTDETKSIIGYGENSSYQNYITTYIAKNVPAFKEESYLSSISNYISYIEHEVSSVKFPNALPKYFTQDWNTIKKELMEEKYYGGILESSGSLKETVNKITLGLYDQNDRAKAIYNHVKNTMKWNHENSILADRKLNSIYESKVGNSAEINLLLTCMLREASIHSYPIIISSRDNGIALISYPILNKFNCVISTAIIGNDTILLDATNQNSPFNMLPLDHLNGEGELIGEIEPLTIELRPQKDNVEMTSADFKIFPETKEIRGKIQVSSKGYCALERRNQLLNSENKKDFAKEIQDKNPDLSIGSIDLQNFDSIEHPAKVLLNDISISLTGKTTGSIITINPLFYGSIKENPFKDEERKYPVDFVFPFSKTYILNLELPEGFAVDEMPKSIILSLPNNAGKLVYNITNDNGKIQLLIKLTFIKIFFIGDEYKQLREFYNKIISKEAELIVLKKL